MTEQEKVIRLGIMIFDLDGCVIDDSHRLPLIRKSTPRRASDYADYHRAMNGDVPLDAGVARIQHCIDNQILIFFATARPVSLVAETRQQIEKFFGLRPDIDYLLAMRPAGDLRPAPDLKLDMLNGIQEWATEKGSIIIGAFDDREDIVAAYRSAGVAAWVLNKDGTEAPWLEKNKEIDPEEFNAPAKERDRFGNQLGVGDALIEDGPVQPPSEEGYEEVDVLTAMKDLNLLPSTDQILHKMADMFCLKNAQYDDNSVVVGRVMRALFPNGVTITTEADYEFWHLFELSIVKLTRFTQSKLRHQDSIHDQAIYLAMCERLVDNHNIQIN